MTHRLGAALAAVIALSCTKVGTDPNAVVALVFNALPYPAVVIGDTLRDEGGIAIPLQATAVNSNGDPVQGASVEYIVLDAGVTIGDGNLVVSSGSATATARIVAQAGILQSRPLTLIITPRPDSAAHEGTVDTLRYAVPDNTSNVSGAFTVRVVGGEDESLVNVRGWIVRYAVEYNGATLPPTDNTTAWFVDPAGRRSAIDTTEADGRASRRLRVVSTALTGASALDSLIVTATVTARGAPLAGSPLRILIPAIPR